MALNQKPLSQSEMIKKHNRKIKKTKKKLNPWIIHVKKVMSLKSNKDKQLKEILKIAKATYKKSNL